MGRVRGIWRNTGAWRRVALLALLTLPAMACNDGDECDTCSSDEDCEANLVCSTFSDGSRRCGSGVGESSCRVR